MWRERSLSQPVPLGPSPNTCSTEAAPISHQGLFTYLRTSVGQLMNTIIDARPTVHRQLHTSAALLQTATSENTSGETEPPKIIPFEEYRERLINDLDERHSRQWETTGKTLRDNNDGLFSPDE